MRTGVGCLVFGVRWKQVRGYGMAKLESFRELRVYQELLRLHLEVHRDALEFPKFELYELGSQVRRSTNSAPANLAEGWGSRHTNIYLESINRSMGEVRETQHHLTVARDKGYITDERFLYYDDAYDKCGRMLERLHQSLSEWRTTTRTGNVVREERASYSLATDAMDWDEMLEVIGETVLGDDEHRTPNTHNP